MASVESRLVVNPYASAPKGEPSCAAIGICPTLCALVFAPGSVFEGHDAIAHQLSSGRYRRASATADVCVGDSTVVRANRSRRMPLQFAPAQIVFVPVGAHAPAEKSCVRNRDGLRRRERMAENVLERRRDRHGIGLIRIERVRTIAIVDASSPGTTRVFTDAGAGETVIAAAIVEASIGFVKPMIGSPFSNRPPVPGVGCGRRQRKIAIGMDASGELCRGSARSRRPVQRPERSQCAYGVSVSGRPSA